MPHPIQSQSRSSDLVAGYYDTENGQCVSAEPAPATCAKSSEPHPAAASCAAEPNASRQAVERLVAAQARKPPPPEPCDTQVYSALLKCALTSVGVIASTRGDTVALVQTAGAGAECALNTINAYRCITRSE